eukprot:maker-scaffold785_size97262-snap-gene-0.14 protein:Tk00300 transcript:maker-scaffold785_size97262-snap-gene-0.14-mRNA-1 annotation:"suppressor of lurcher protein 1"
MHSLFFVLFLHAWGSSAHSTKLLTPAYSQFGNFMRNGEMSTAPPPTPIVPGITPMCSDVLIETLETNKCYEIESPNYNMPPYPTATEGNGAYQCRYRFKDPVGMTGGKLTIRASEFELQDSSGCSKDFLRIAGTSGGQTEAVVSDNTIQFCGNLNNDQVLDIAKGPILNILFRTDFSDSDYRGFKFTFCYD